jgi:hypothetical protein
LVAIGNDVVTDMNGARRLLRGLCAGDPLRLGVVRNGQRLLLEDAVRPFPVEQHPDAEVVLDQVQVGEHRLRAIALLPEKPGPHPVVYYLSGAHWASEEYPFSVTQPVPALLGELARVGIASLRVDRFGMGDSEGPPCHRVDFDTEYAGYRGGLELLKRAPWSDPERVLFMGHSLGAMVAPLMASDPAAALRPLGILTFGASAIPISSGLEGALQRYAIVQPTVEQQTIALQCELMRLIVRGGKTPAQALRERPDLRAVTPEHYTDDSIYRRTVAFYHQLEQRDIEHAWRQFTQPVLAIHGSHDWICAPDDSARIAELAPRGQTARAEWTDHQLSDVRQRVGATRDPVADAPDRPTGAQLRAATMPSRSDPLVLSPSLRDLVRQWALLQVAG